jgi:uncharacterized protein GlcG (DUF336 family)
VSPHSSSTAQRAVVVATITAAFATELVAAAESAAAEVGTSVVVSVCDRDGNLKAFLRMDGASLLSVGIAQDKAYTAASFGIPTDRWIDLLKGDEGLRTGIPHTPRFVVFGGGFPVRVDGELVGGLGISGGSVQEDMAVGTAALRAVGLEPG